MYEVYVVEFLHYLSKLAICTVDLFYRWYWEIMMVVVLLLTLAFLPVQVAFLSHEGKQDTQWIILNSCIDVLFMIDILVNFRTGYMESQTEKVTSPPAIGVMNSSLQVSYFTGLLANMLRFC